MITAANSPMALPHARSAPYRIWRVVRGRLTVINALAREAPRLRATFSSWTGTLPNPSRTAFT